MKYRIVADSSSDVQSLSQVEFASVPLKVTVGSETFVDDDATIGTVIIADVLGTGVDVVTTRNAKL